MTRCWICSAPTPLREAAHPESPNGAPRRAASEQRRDRSAVRVLEHCSSSSGTVTIGSRPRVLDAAIGCRYLASITTAAKRADGRRVEPPRHDIRANEMSTRRATARRCRGRPLAGEGGHDPTRRSRDPRCPEAAANKATNGVELVPASLPRAATGSPARARSQSSETGHAGRRRRASARRRLRSPRDPRRSDRVRTERSCRRRAWLLVMGDCRSSIGDIGEHEPTSAFQGWCLRPRGSELATEPPAARNPAHAIPRRLRHSRRLLGLLA